MQMNDNSLPRRAPGADRELALLSGVRELHLVISFQRFAIEHCSFIPPKAESGCQTSSVIKEGVLLVWPSVIVLHIWYGGVADVEFVAALVGHD